jgi:adenylosuccinate synthase
MRLLVVLSGPVAVGKSAFCSQLEGAFGAYRVSTRAWLVEKAGAEKERGSLQAAGDRLDLETGGSWVAEAVAEKAATLAQDAVLLIDSARITAQVRELRRRFGDLVFHVHLHAADETLERRYLARPVQSREFSTYSEVRRNPTEAAIGELAANADLVLDTDYADSSVLAMTAMAYRGEKVIETMPIVDVIVGGQYGSEGKGNICAHLAKRYGVLMRIGGPNAGHKVKEPRYTYVQLPSGTGSNPDAAVLIGAGSTLWLPQLCKEISDHPRMKERLSIDGHAMVIEEDDRQVEAETLQSIASTKQGVGVAAARKILNRGSKPIFGAAVRLAKDVSELAPYVRDVRAELLNHYRHGTPILLEGTQGTLLSLHHGIWPSVTSRETSSAGCLSDAGIAPKHVRRTIMVVRTYPIRVGGTSGWMGREIDMKTVASRSGIPESEFDQVERGTISGNLRRVAEFDWAQLSRAALLNGATDIAVTFADYLGVENRKARTFAELNEAARTFIRRVERVTGVEVSLVSKEFAIDGVLEREGRE